jgi:hypothetical protein
LASKGCGLKKGLTVPGVTILTLRSADADEQIASKTWISVAPLIENLQRLREPGDSVVRRERIERAIAGSACVLDRLRGIHGRGGRGPVAGELAYAPTRVVVTQLLQGLGNAEMNSAAPGADQSFVEAVLDQRVGEREAIRLLDHYTGCGRGLQEIHQLDFGSLAQGSEQLEVEDAPDDRRLRQDRMYGLAEAPDSLTDDLAHALGQADVSEIGPRRPAAVSRQHEHA